MRGAGGSDGGVGRFIMGLVMFIGGGYLFLENIRVHSPWRWGHALFNVGGFGITSGMVLVPFVLGVGMVFYSSKNPLGWVLSLGSIVAIMFGVLSQVSFALRDMSIFSLITMLVCFVGGAGLLLSGLRDQSRIEDRRGGQG